MVKICADCHNTCKECKTANTIDKCTLCNYPSRYLVLANAAAITGNCNCALGYFEDGTL